MSRRAYNQFCGLAGALDIVGERWTLLIVRDLSGGPKRYSDLAGSLEGIGTSLLAARLKQMESDDLIARRDLPPPAASTVYELTDTGWELVDALTPLVAWGAKHGLEASRPPTQSFRPEWSLALAARALREARGDGATPITIEFTIDDMPAVVTINDQQSSVSPGRAGGMVDASIVTDSTTLVSAVAGRMSLEDAVANGQIQASGDPTVLVDFATILSQARH